MTYHLLLLLTTLLSYIPFCILYPLSNGLFYLLYYVIQYRKKIVHQNLKESFPKKDDQEIKLIEKKFYRFFTDMILESIKMTSISPEEIARRMKFINAEKVNASIRQGKSISIYLGHFGNWEWIASMPLYLEKMGDKIIGAQIYHKLRNKNMDKLMLRNRERMGSVCVEMKKTARFVNQLAIDHKVGVIGFIADQSPQKKDSIHFVPFLNHKTPVLTGTERIIKHYDYEAWFLHVKKIKRGYYEAEFIKMHENPQSLPDFQLTTIYFQLLEKEILSQPELYLWTHNRFKHAKKLD